MNRETAKKVIDELEREHNFNRESKELGIEKKAPVPKLRRVQRRQLSRERGMITATPVVGSQSVLGSRPILHNPPIVRDRPVLNIGQSGIFDYPHTPIIGRGPPAVSNGPSITSSPIFGRVKEKEIGDHIFRRRRR